MHKLYEAVKACVRFFIRWWPFGYLWEEKDGEGGYIRLTKQLWIITGDGRSKDALPLNFCSQQLVDHIAADLSKKWYQPAKDSND